MDNKNERAISEVPLFQTCLDDLIGTSSHRCGGNKIFLVFDELASLADQSNDPEVRERHLAIRHAAGHTEGIEPPEMQLRRIGPIQTGRTRRSPIRVENTEMTFPEALSKSFKTRD